MSEEEFQSLMDLAKREAEKVLTKEEALAELVSAGILDKDGNFTEPYKDLALLGDLKQYHVRYQA
jgi:hypothetical protein